MTNDYERIADEVDALKDSGKEFEGLVPVRAKTKGNAEIVYSVRFTQEDMQLIDEKAKAKGMKTSAFIRAAVLKTVTQAEDSSAEEARLARELDSARDAIERARRGLDRM